MMKTLKRYLIIGFIAVALAVPVLGLFSNAPISEPTTPELIAYEPTKSLNLNKKKIDFGGGGLDQKLGYTWGG